MKNSVEMGLNRSGLATAPRMAPQALEVAAMTAKTTGDATLIAGERVAYSKEAEPAATMPPPGSLKELASTTLKIFKGQKATLFVDKVGERMGFERGGVRLYEALISKLDAFGSWDRGPTRIELEEIRREELEHFNLLGDVMGQLGADPTAVTPSAEVADLLASGSRLVLSDPRIDLRFGLEAILQLELADNDCWMTLTRLALGYSEQQLAERFQRCLEEERVHLARVRGWLSAGLSVEAFNDSRRLQSTEPWVQAHGGPVPQRSLRSSSGSRSAKGKGGNGSRRVSGGKRNGNGAQRRKSR